MRTLLAVVAVVAVGCSAVSCTAANDTPKVSKKELQNDVSHRLTATGAVPKSVICPDDLIGEVGRSVRCTVTTMGASGAPNSFEPRITVTSVEGSTVNYDVIPVESKAQLEALISQQMAKSYQAAVQSVACESDLDGKVGAITHCAVTTKGVTLRRTVEVTSVTGFTMNYDVVPILTKDAAASSLLAQLEQVGPRPDSASCANDMDGKPGNTVECTAVTRGRPEVFILTVTTVTGNNIACSYARKP